VIDMNVYAYYKELKILAEEHQKKTAAELENYLSSINALNAEFLGEPHESVEPVRNERR